MNKRQIKATTFDNCISKNIVEHSVNSQGQKGPRSGFFYNFSPKEVVVRQWDAQSEDIKPSRLTEEELSPFIANKKDMDKFLGPYPYDKYKQWVSLSKHISWDLVSMLQPDCGSIYSVPQFESESSTSQSRHAALQNCMETNTSTEGNNSQKDEILPQLNSVVGTKIKYTKVPKQRYPAGATPSEITKYSMDSSYALNLMLGDRFDNNFEYLLGEIQFAFICFLIGQDYDSFEQWKHLVHIMCTSAEAIVSHADAYLSFISILYFQVREIPSDFFVDIVSNNNFLTSTLHELFHNIVNESHEVKLLKKSRDFKNHLTEKFKWDFTAEPDEYAPVVVECP